MQDTQPLATLQQWMQQVISHPNGIAAGILSPVAQALIPIGSGSLESIIRRSRSLDGADRLAVYGNAYFARLLECLAAEFPATATALGENIFQTFCVGYLQLCPSRSYSLSGLGAGFPEYLRQTRPSEVPAPGWPDFLIDLATLERTYSDVFDGPGVEGETLLDIAALQAVPVSRIPDVVFEPVPCLRLLQVRFPVHEYATAVRERQIPELPEPLETYLVVTRRAFVVRRGAVSRSEFLLLDALLQGRRLADAIETAASDPAADLQRFEECLPEWFQKWASAGWFRTVRIQLP